MGDGGGPEREALAPGDTLAAALAEVIRTGDVEGLAELLAAQPWLARAQVVDAVGVARTPLHLATDWPGQRPRTAEVVAVLVGAGADVDARLTGGPAPETPLHWAASSDDVVAVDALLDAGADIDANGGVIAGGAPLTDAVAFGQWRAAQRLVERGAAVPLREAAALGLRDRLLVLLDGTPPPAADELHPGLWYACHGGQQEAAELLIERGADPAWVSPWDGLDPAGAAERSGAMELARWLRRRRDTTS